MNNHNNDTLERQGTRRDDGLGGTPTSIRNNNDRNNNSNSNSNSNNRNNNSNSNRNNNSNSNSNSNIRNNNSNSNILNTPNTVLHKHNSMRNNNTGVETLISLAHGKVVELLLDGFYTVPDIVNQYPETLIYELVRPRLVQRIEDIQGSNKPDSMAYLKACLCHFANINYHKNEEEKQNSCIICMDKQREKVYLECGHNFCDACFNVRASRHSKTCPMCGVASRSIAVLIQKIAKKISQFKNFDTTDTGAIRLIIRTLKQFKGSRKEKKNMICQCVVEQLILCGQIGVLDIDFNNEMFEILRKELKKVGRKTYKLYKKKYGKSMKIAQACKIASKYGNLHDICALTNYAFLDLKENIDSKDSNECLLHAINSNNVCIVKYILLYLKVDLSLRFERKNGDHFNALHFLVRNARCKIDYCILAHLLLHKTCSNNVINEKDSFGNTPLDLASEHCGSRIVLQVLQLLIENGGMGKLTPLMLLCKHGDEVKSSSVKLNALDPKSSLSNLNISAVDAAGNNALHICIMSNTKNLFILKALLHHCPLDVMNAANLKGESPLDCIDYNTHQIKSDIALQLLESGAKSSSSSRLLCAVKHLVKKLRIFKELVTTELLEEEDLDISTLDSHRRNALHYIAQVDTHDSHDAICTIDLFLRHSTCTHDVINRQDEDGLTPLMYAAKYENINCFRYSHLCENSNIKVKTENGWNVFHFAAFHTKSIHRDNNRRKLRIVVMDMLLDHDECDHEVINELCDYNMSKYSPLDIIYHCHKRSNLSMKLWDLLISKGARKTNPGWQ